LNARKEGGREGGRDGTYLDCELGTGGVGDGEVGPFPVVSEGGVAREGGREGGVIE